MSNLMQFAGSSVGRKVAMAVTGLGLAAFVATHLVGNFTLLLGPEAFNEYAHFLEHLVHGGFIYAAEAGLVAFFLLHAISGLKVYLQKRKARPVPYARAGDAGGPSRKTLASRSMILTGPLLLLFVVLHVCHFKFGPGVAERYVYDLHGVEIRDLYRLVVEQFNRWEVVVAYVGAMVLLGLHLRHGFWSAFQSLGASNDKWIRLLTAMGWAVAVLLAVGFVYIPVHVLLFVEPVGPATVSLPGPEGGLS
jgi:succinate dehydrogenase / fumarate reductase cytochrome b subunit